MCKNLGVWHVINDQILSQESFIWVQVRGQPLLSDLLSKVVDSSLSVQKSALKGLQNAMKLGLKLI